LTVKKPPAPIPTIVTPSAATTVPPLEAVTVATVLEVVGESKCFIALVAKGIKAGGFPVAEAFEDVAVVRGIEDYDVTGFHVVEAFEGFDDEFNLV